VFKEHSHLLKCLTKKLLEQVANFQKKQFCLSKLYKVHQMSSLTNKTLTHVSSWPLMLAVLSDMPSRLYVNVDEWWHLM